MKSLLKALAKISKEWYFDQDMMQWVKEYDDGSIGTIMEKNKSRFVCFLDEEEMGTTSTIDVAKKICDREAELKSMDKARKAPGKRRMVSSTSIEEIVRAAIEAITLGVSDLADSQGGDDDKILDEVMKAVNTEVAIFRNEIKASWGK